MKVLHKTIYHKVLRVALVVCACVLVFESGVLSTTTTQLSQQTHQYLANAIGVGASIQPTELSSLTAEVTEQKLALAEREEALIEREIAVELAAQTSNNDYATYLTAGILFILLVLIVLNYTLDYLHRREVVLRGV